jgi:hypothetical protein
VLVERAEHRHQVPDDLRTPGVGDVQLGATAVELVGTPLDVAARDEAVDDAGRRGGRHLEPSGDLCGADLLATEVLERHELRLAEARAPRHDVVDPAPGRDEVAEREERRGLGPLPAPAHPRRGRGRALVVRHGRPHFRSSSPRLASSWYYE